MSNRLCMARRRLCTELGHAVLLHKRVERVQEPVAGGPTQSPGGCPFRLTQW